MMSSTALSLSRWIMQVGIAPLLICSCSALPRAADVEHPATPEAAIRAMFHANETRNMAELQRLVSKDGDMVGYSVGGRKYVGWNELAREMQQEFETVTRLDIPIKELHVWERGDFAWYTAEIDYIRYEGSGEDARKMLLPLRESGVLERRDGRWLLVQWHESFTRAPETQPLGSEHRASRAPALQSETPIDVSGEWTIQEEEKTYRAVLDASGNGDYTWQGGRLLTTRIAEGHWEGIWHQSGN